MPRKTQRQIIEELLGRHAPRIQQALLEAIAELRNGTTLRVIAERLERGDIPGAIEALNIEPEAFSRVEIALLEAYNAGGQATVENLPRVTDPEGRPIIFRWGVRNLPAEQELRDHAAAMVRGVTEDAREGIRQVLTEGLARGDNPWTTAKDIAGRKNRANNTREGGYLGLDPQQMETAKWIKRALLENDTAALKRYLGMTDGMIGMPRRKLLATLKGRGIKQRSRRFDGAIADVIEGKARVDPEKAVKVYSQYAERALDYRGRRFARHETMIALSKSRYDAYEQQIDAGKVDADDMTKTWLRTPRENPRLQHTAMHGQTVPFNEPFIAPDGTRLRYPHDPDAPLRHTLGCQCRSEFRIDFTAAALRRYRARTAA